MSDTATNKETAKVFKPTKEQLEQELQAAISVA